MEGPQDQYASIYYSTLIASLGGLLVGYSTVIISGVLLFLGRYLNIGVEQQEILVSVAVLMGIFGTLSGGLCSNLLGRRTTLLIAAVIFMIASILALFSQQYYFLLLSRAIIGFAAGMASMAVPLYISEIVPSNIRGSSVCILTLMFYLGVLLAYLIDSLWGFSKGWQLTLGSPFIPALALFVGMWRMPETPQWLLGMNREEKAVKALTKLRRFVDIEWEIENIKESTQFNEKFRSRLFGKGVLKAIFIGCGIAFFMEVTGAHSIYYYIPSILEMDGLWSKQASVDSSLYMGIISFVGALLAILLIDRHGRRTLLLVGTAIMSIALFSLSIVFFFHSFCLCHTGLLFSLFLLFSFGFVIGLGSVGYLLIAEIFPLKIRSFLIAVALTVKWTVNYFISRYFLSQLSEFGGPQTFFFYALVGLVCLAFIYFFVPETGGKSLEAIEEYWLKDSKHGIQIE